MSAPDTLSWLVATKLHPPALRSDTIPRPQLEEALCRSVSSLPLTLLSAPAGYGKTTLLAALPHLMPDRPLAWVTLEAEENDPIRFIALMTAALQRLHPGCGQSVWPQLAGGSLDAAGLRRAIAALVGDILTWLPTPFTLVLDDLHFVTEPAVYVALEFLLDHLPVQMHLATGTRSDPPLRLARLAARRQLGELRRPDLGFSPSEAHQLLNETLALQLTEDEVAVLQERTEGWPAGLCLLAGPLARLGAAADRAHFLAAIAHSERYALDFLAEEVLRNLPDDLRRFLLQTSVLAELTPTGCRAVTGREDAAEVLDGLYRHNLAIAAISAGAEAEPVYRYHALFTRLLTQQLEREMPGEIPLLHARAAGAQRAPGRAINHYLAAGLWDEAARLIIQCGMDLLHRGMSETIRQWYGALPADLIQRHPRLMLLLARCEIERGDYAAAGAHLEQARVAFVAAGDQMGEGEAVISLLTPAVQNDDRTQAAGLVARALELPLAPPGRLVALLVSAWLKLAGGDWHSIPGDVQAAYAIPPASGDRVAAVLGFFYTSAPLLTVPGCLELAERYCGEAGALAPPASALRLGADELAAWCLLLRGQTAEALERARAAETLRHQIGGWVVLGVDAALLLTVLHLAQGDLEAAGQAADTLLQRIQKAPRSRWPLYLHAAGRALALLGRRAEAEAACGRLLAIHDDLALTRYLQDHLAGLIALLDRRPNDALHPLRRAADLETQLPTARIGGSARLLLARLHLEQGRQDAAREAAAAVLSEWERAGTPGCALLDGPAIAPVLPLSKETVRPEGITEREWDVLRLIVAGRTNRQIGEELYITEETVKTHVARLLRKLDVTSRTQAALRGRELGL